MLNYNNNRQSKAIMVLFLAVFVDLLEFGIIIPLLPFWALNLGATPFIYGVLTSLYSFMSFALAPVWGRFSDKYGRRPVILAGLIGTVVGLLLLVLAASVFTDSLILIFFSRIVGGFFTAATLPTSQAYISDMTTGKDRARGFGLLGAAFGLGFATGPAIGGILTEIGGYLLPSVFATLIALINLFAAIKYLPESLTDETRRQYQNRKLILSEDGRNSIKSILINNPLISLSIFLFALISFAFSKMQTTLALLGEIRFGLNESLTGAVFFVVGLIVVITQGGLIRPLTGRFSDSALFTFGLFFLTIGFLGLSTVRSLTEMIIWIIPLSVGSSISNPTLGAFLSKRTPSKSSGTILGLNQGIGSLMRVIGPLIGTALFEINEAFPYYLGAVVLCAGFVLAFNIWFKSKKEIRYSPCINCGLQLREGTAACSQCGISKSNK
ncbi:MAG: MFS transporter [Candidatus Heimdallarchaeota archaeon]|nr:MFS transporter [Candidatus Heimdallarchaeota archaeon]